MKSIFTALLVAAAGLSLASCTETSGGAAPATASAGTPTPAQQACLAAVSRETSNGDVTVLSSDFSQAGTLVTIGVGPQRAPWKCIAYSDGTTDGIESLTNEGTL